MRTFFKRFRKVSALLVSLAVVLTVLTPTIAMADTSAGLFARVVHPNGYWAVDITNIHPGQGGPWPETQNVYHTNIHLWYYPGADAAVNGWNKIEAANLHVTAHYSLSYGWCYWIYDQVTGYQKKNCDSQNQTDLQTAVRNAVSSAAASITSTYNNVLLETWISTYVAGRLFIEYLWDKFDWGLALH